MQAASDRQPAARVSPGQAIVYRVSAGDIDLIERYLPRAWRPALGDAFPGKVTNVRFQGWCDLQVHISDTASGAKWTLPVQRANCGPGPGQWLPA